MSRQFPQEKLQQNVKLPARKDGAISIFFFSSLFEFILIAHKLVKQMIYDICSKYTHLKTNNHFIFSFFSLIIEQGTTIQE